MPAHRCLAVLMLFVAILFIAAPPLAAVDLALEPAFDLPLAVAATALPDDDRLFVTTIDGQVRVWQDGALRPEPFLDIRHRVRGAGAGLWSVAFHPDFAATGYVFAHYAEVGSGAAVISRFSLEASGERLDPASEKILLRTEKVQQLHYGGEIRFGPDGMLYVATGDSTSSEAGPDPLCVAQSLDSLEGKLLRIDVDQNVDTAPYHGIPFDNPFASEIWAYGLRNPWRFSFDRQSGDLWLSDVGQDRREEINLQRASEGAAAGGRNYGWKVMEGTSCFGDLAGCSNVPACGDPELFLPVLEYALGGGRCAVIGGFVYRGTRVPSLFGRYLYGDFCSGEIWAARESGQTWVADLLPITLPGLSSFGEDAAGELVLIAGGQVFSLVDRDVPAAGLLEFETARVTVDEGAGTVEVGVRRVAGSAGEVRVTVRAESGSATAGSDFIAGSAELLWDDGDDGRRTFTLQILDDDELEPTESLRLVLEAPSGGAALGSRTATEIEIVDDEACTAGPTTLCLNDNRFQVDVGWRDYEDRTGPGQARLLTDSGGFFWFFSPDNPELFVKVLTGCEINGFYWVFAAGLTDVEVRLEIVDTETGERRSWDNALGRLFSTIRDLRAFPCP